eukprot:TRINITY_DN6433_c0_g1_i13.p2 TRINITY_DN6433_c0_g1~~TRINITY_DN6433_c0_g1_i13.p2  ORF type:complete len:122 (+),score=9.72 TRINITY_DN6433_c0_g1_i13:121-486(+)
MHIHKFICQRIKVSLKQTKCFRQMMKIINLRKCFSFSRLRFLLIGCTAHLVFQANQNRLEGVTLRPVLKNRKLRRVHLSSARVHTVHILSLIHISEPTRLGMISYAVFCLKKKKKASTRFL